MPLALFGITDDGLNLAVNLVILVLVVLWLALAYWTFADARRRVADPVLVITASVLGLIVPFLGPMIYTILRPPEYLEDVREREIETQASELRMRHLTSQSCPRCEHPIERSWLRCPECQHRLKDPCVSCSRPVDPRWSICPYCETQLRRQSSEQSTDAPRKRSRSNRDAVPARSERSSKSAEPPKRPTSGASRSSAEPAEPSPRNSSSDDDDAQPTGTRSRRRSTTPS